MIVSVNTIQASGFDDFFKNLGARGINISEKGENFLENREWALNITANVSRATASGNPKAILSTSLDLKIFCHTGEGIYLGWLV